MAAIAVLHAANKRPETRALEQQRLHTWIMPSGVAATAVLSLSRDAFASILSWRGDRAGTCGEGLGWGGGAEGGRVSRGEGQQERSAVVRNNGYSRGASAATMAGDG